MIKYLFVAGVIVLLVAAAGWFFVTRNVAEPKFAVVAEAGNKQLRDYPALVVAEVRRSGDRQAAVRAGFRPLANYIFAKERAGDTIAMTAPVTQSREKIAMTAPVTQSPSGDGEDWRVRFIMPEGYSLATLPKPGNSDVRLLDVPAARRAAITFSGVADDALIAENEQALRQWLDANGIVPKGAPTYAYYNDPLTPGFLRRNEVLFDVAPDATVRTKR